MRKRIGEIEGEFESLVELEGIKWPQSDKENLILKIMSKPQILNYEYVAFAHCPVESTRSGPLRNGVRYVITPSQRA